MYCEFVFVALGIQHALRMCHIAIWGVSVPTVFLYVILETARFSKKRKEVVEHEMCVLIFCTAFV
jgi:hypothetical protein